jgi:hypothetical protein
MPSEELLPFTSPEQITDENWNELHGVLVGYIQHLLERNHSQLMQIFYRLDVSEQAVQQIFSTQPPHTWADFLATEVLKREQKRLYWRNFYRDKGE